MARSAERLDQARLVLQFLPARHLGDDLRPIRDRAVLSDPGAGGDAGGRAIEAGEGRLGPGAALRQPDPVKDRQHGVRAELLVLG